MNKLYRNYLKRLFDIILALILLVCLSPLILLTAFLVRIKLGSPIIFKQIRPGRHNELFNMYKFRTMKDDYDSQGSLLPDEMRLTEFGKMLRATSLDELPELWNILKGDMSFIGPRPLLVEYLTLYNKEQLRRHEVRPGLTGLAQVNGRNAISWDRKFMYDIIYVDSISFRQDMKILLATMNKVITREGISSESSVTMEKFGGNNE